MVIGGAKMLTGPKSNHTHARDEEEGTKAPERAGKRGQRGRAAELKAKRTAHHRRTAEG